MNATALDARGIPCPKPVLMAEEALAAITEGSLVILVDNEASVSNLTRFASKNGCYAENRKEGSHWRVTIVKGYPCVIQEQPQTGPKKDLLLVVAADVIGRDETLGRILMKATFETMKVTKELPHTIILMNTGVYLSTTNEEVIPILRDFAALGVEIFSCGTCLKHFGLEGSLKVGFRGSTNNLVEGMKEFEKTVWIC